MTPTTRLRWVLALTAVLSLTVLPAAHAYVDPGSASFIFAWFVAALAAAGMTLRMFWSRLRRLFRRGGDDGRDPTGDPRQVGADVD